MSNISVEILMGFILDRNCFMSFACYSLGPSASYDSECLHIYESSHTLDGNRHIASNEIRTLDPTAEGG
jgi:hypothetical protein